MLVARLCLTLRNPIDYSPPGSSVHEILQARIMEWVAVSFSRDLPHPGIEPSSPALQADSLLSQPPGKDVHSVRRNTILTCIAINNIFSMTVLSPDSQENKNIKPWFGVFADSMV